MDRLVSVAAEGDVAALDALLKEGFDGSMLSAVAQEATGDTPLHICISQLKEHVDAAELMLSAGAEVNVVNGQTPLQLAAAGGHAKTLALLARAGAALNTQDESGRTAAYRAVERGQFECIALLRGLGADFCAADEDEVTPLHVAAAHRNPRMVAECLAAGAQPGAKDDEGSTAADLVDDPDDPVGKALREGGADGRKCLELLLDACEDSVTNAAELRAALEAAAVGGVGAAVGGGGEGDEV